MDVQSGRTPARWVRSAFASLGLAAVAAPAAAHTHPADTLDGGRLPAPSPFRTEAAWQAEGFRVAESGRQARGAFLQLTELGLAAEAALRDGGSLRTYLQVLGIGGDDLAARTGDLQGVSNIEAPASWRVYQAWVEAELSGGFAALAGLYDLNSDFYVTEASGVFLNPSHGIGPEFAFTGAGGPSIFPATALAVRLRWEARDGITWRAALLDATPGAPGAPESAGVALSREEGALAVSEVEIAGSTYRDGGAGVRAVVGAWAYTSPVQTLVPALAGAAREGNQGAYAIVEWGADACDGGGACLRAFARAGLADAQVNALSSAWGAGLTLEAEPDGLLVGLGLAGARSGAAFREAGRRDGQVVGLDELNVELTARLPLGSRFALQPDLQYILDPGLDPSRSGVFVIGARIHLQF